MSFLTSDFDVNGYAIDVDFDAGSLVLRVRFFDAITEAYVVLAVVYFVVTSALGFDTGESDRFYQAPEAGSP